MQIAEAVADTNINEARIGFALLELLWSYYILLGLIPESDNLIENLKTMKVVSLLTDDIILRLCKLRDNDGRTLSFNQLSRHCSQGIADRARERDIRAKIRRFRGLTENLENHRNSYIAHLSSEPRSHLSPTTEIYDALREALEIWDILKGEVVSYKIVDLDLRIEIFKSEAA